MLGSKVSSNQYNPEPGEYADVEELVCTKVDENFHRCVLDARGFSGKDTHTVMVEDYNVRGKFPYEEYYQDQDTELWRWDDGPVCIERGNTLTCQ